MRKYISLFFSAIVVLCACNDTPGGVIEKEKMVDVLMDVHIIDGTMFNVSSMPDSAYKYGTGRYINVFKNHDTDSAQFNRSLKYYTSKPEVLKTMYDTITARLQIRVDSVNKELQREQAKNAKQSTAMMRGKGMMPGSVKRMDLQDSMKVRLKFKADSVKTKTRSDSLRLRSKLKADSIRNKKRIDSLKAKKSNSKLLQKKA
ncbi:MAG: DUF4296 domain-containing protein [Sphingobacteriaceae bacterium]|nr:MAG: DUF4296 domain-containing protein [Sphingobacteriaceae bacterium]